MIPFTKPFLPNRKVYDEFVDGIWERNWITNHGPLVEALEKNIAEYLGVKHVSFVSSGTMALQLMLKMLPPSGEVITTPFSYAATTGALAWQGYTPIFADILPGKLTIDPERVREKITPQTKAILATHIYGNACEVEALELIGKEFSLPILYDGAHCFGSRYADKSILKYGDMSILSTHATKLYHTVNGGFVISKNAGQKLAIDRMRNFGHNGQNNFERVGINGKNSEFHAAMGLAILENIGEIVNRRKKQSAYYFQNLMDSNFELIEIKNAGETNGAYFPVICRSKQKSQDLMDSAKSAGIELRRYFNPSLNTLDYVNYSPCPIAESISERIICLPLYHDMTRDDQDKVLTEIKKSHG